MARLREQLLKTLEDLREEEFKRFRWLLKEEQTLEGLPGIAACRLEQADRMDTVDLLFQTYQDQALLVSLQTLKKISRNDLVQCLEMSTRRTMDEGIKSQERAGLKAELQAKVKQMIQERQMKIREIQRCAETSRRSADRHIADSERVFTDLLESVRATLSGLVHDIQEKRSTTQRTADESIQELQQEISELEKKGCEVEQSAPTDQQLDFLKSLTSSLSSAGNYQDRPALSVPSYGVSVATAVKPLQEKLQELISRVKLIRVQESARDVTLDPDTANPFLVLSQDLKQVHCGAVRQDVPDSPMRFSTAINVLGKQSVSSGRFYYEVQVKGKTSWDLGVVKESVVRGGPIAARPGDGYWTMCLRDGEKYQTSTKLLRLTARPEKVGVFVDYEKGSVSFYDVGSSELLHCFQHCSFTEKLYPFFSPGRRHDGQNSSPLVICPVSSTDQV